MNGKGTQAHRMDFRTHVDDELMKIRTEEMETQTGEEQANDEAMAQLSEIAALKDHPGWVRVKDILKDKIKDYRDGKPLEEMVGQGDLSNEQFGALMRGCLMVARELEAIQAVVETAAEAVETEKTRKRTERQQNGPKPRI